METKLAFEPLADKEPDHEAVPTDHGMGAQTQVTLETVVLRWQQIRRTTDGLFLEYTITHKDIHPTYTFSGSDEVMANLRVSVILTGSDTDREVVLG